MEMVRSEGMLNDIGVAAVVRKAVMPLDLSPFSNLAAVAAFGEVT